MTRKRARKILMAIGTSRNHANWGLVAKCSILPSCRRAWPQQTICGSALQ